MKTLTISVTDDVYERASQKAAAAETSLPKVIQELLTEWTEQFGGSSQSGAAEQRRADWSKMLDELASRPLRPGPSVGPLNREELYQRGVSGH